MPIVQVVKNAAMASAFDRELTSIKRIASQAVRPDAQLIRFAQLARASAASTTLRMREAAESASRAEAVLRAACATWSAGSVYRSTRPSIRARIPELTWG